MKIIEQGIGYRSGRKVERVVVEVMLGERGDAGDQICKRRDVICMLKFRASSPIVAVICPLPSVVSFLPTSVIVATCISDELERGRMLETLEKYYIK